MKLIELYQKYEQSSQNGIKPHEIVQLRNRLLEIVEFNKKYPLTAALIDNLLKDTGNLLGTKK